MNEMPFKAEEFLDRRDRVIDLMKQSGLEAIVVTSTPNFYYLSGLPISVVLGIFALVLRRDGQGYWIGRRTEMSNVSGFVERAGWSEIARSIGDEEDAYEAFGQALSKLVSPGSDVGFELDAKTIAPRGVTEIARHAGGLKIINSSGLVESLRAVKSVTEIAYLRAAGQITGQAIKTSLANLKEGDTDSDLASYLFSNLNRLGSDPLPLLPMVTAGPRSAEAHTTFANLPLNRGELITVETGGVVARYCAPVYRIAMRGEPSAELARFHDASRAGLLAGMEKIGPGLTSHDADRIVREAISEAGYLEYFTVRAGYSVGLGFVPSWDEDHIMKLRPNGLLPVSWTPR